ncbi:MAG: phenylalanine--tRNA ligase subunit beta [Clostridia bacterium]|nr:phenylalanine--tRNA ligase subunit beta [Clostridia bacterium]
MLAPLRWLKDYVEIDVSAEELKNKLFSCGFEVEESVDMFAKVDGIYVAKLLSVEKHPNADKLNVWQIDVGEKGTLQIITNAKNIQEGDLVPVALDGATLFSGDRIFNGQIRGVESFGMFCSGEELGITDDYYPGASVNGILRLLEDYKPGTPIKEALGLDDIIFDIGVTSNRPDCQSILGIAREVASVLNKPLKMPAMTYKTVDKAVTEVVSVKVEDTELCPRYLATAVENITVKESPLWMRKRLFLVGIRGINNLVDITNFVLTEMGQPMHAFDRDKLNQSELIVRRAKEGETIVTLDKKEFTLTEENLVICDGDKPVCLAGVMGGLNSGITEETTSLVFEAAKFKRDNVRKTSRSLGQRSESSARFEKGVDSYTTKLAMDRALALIDELGAGEILSGAIDYNAEKQEKRLVETTVSRITGLLGITISGVDMKEILERLQFEVSLNGETLSVLVPEYREDVENYADLAEEIIRMYGYDNIQGTMLAHAAITNGGKTEAQKNEARVKDVLSGFGLHEIVTYSFISEKDYDKLDLDKTSDEYRYIRLINPLGEDLAAMRTTLAPSMLSTLLFNQNRKNAEVKLFEYARTYHAKALPLAELPVERNNICIGMYGANVDFFTLKGVVEEFGSAFGIEFTFAAGGKGYLHPTRCATVSVNGEVVGTIGELGPVYSDRYGFDKRVYLGELDYDKISAYISRKIKFKAISRYPESSVDIALTVDKKVACADVLAVIRESAGEYLKSASLFDVYEGEQVEKGKKSMAFNLIFGSLDRTLEQSEVESAKANVLARLGEKFGAALR